MTDRALVRTARAVVVVGGALAVGGSTLSIASGGVEYWWRSFSTVIVLLTLCFAAFVWVVIAQQPRNAVVWMMAAASLCGISVIGHAIVSLLTDGDPLELLEASWVPADSPASVGWTLMITEPASTFGLFLPLTFGLLLFPDGTLPSRRWRAVAAPAAAAILVLVISEGAWYRPTNSSTSESLALVVSLMATLVAAVLSLLALVLRFRSSTGATRQQFKWVVWGAAVGVTAFAIPAVLPDAVLRGDVVIVGVTLATGILATAYGIAVGRYRLYDVDVVISRTVVFVSLAIFISVAYVAVVVGVGAAFGGSSLWLSVLATALVAMAFEPLRARVQRWANRLVYGRKANPYEVLADVTERLAESESGEQLLRRLAAYLREGTGGERAVVWVNDDRIHHPVATAPEGGGVSAASLEDLPGVCVPIELEGDVLGAITVEARPGIALTTAERQLVEDLAGSAALVMHKMRLDEALAVKAGELAESRRRLLGAQDDERHRLEHVLRDGVEQQVLALKERLGSARRLAAQEGSVRTSELIDEMTVDTGHAIDQIRSLAQGIYPPRLDADGLGPAISEQAALCPLEVHATIDVVHRHPRVVEGALYFCVSEALTNASKYASGPVSVTVGSGDRDLTFEVTDSGPGFDPASRDRGSGLANMADRLDALGGMLRISSTPGAPTTISGTLPASVPTAAST